MMMQGKRSLILVSLMLIAAMVFAGCAPRLGAGAAASNADANAFYLDMPAILVQYDENGEASLFNTPVADLGEMLGSDLSSLSFEAETVEKLMNNNIQTIEVNNLPNAIRLYTNGKPLPALLWDEEALNSLITTLEGMGTDVGPIGPLVPMLANLGIGLTLQMPARSGQSEVRLQPSNANVVSGSRAVAIFNEAKKVQPGLNLTIDYAPTGEFEIGGINQFMLGMLPVPWDAMKLPPDQIESITGQGIQSLKITTAPGGLLIAVNGNTLPFLNWADVNELSSMLQLVAVMGEEGGMGAMLGSMQPVFTFAGLSITVTFPPAE